MSGKTGIVAVAFLLVGGAFWFSKSRDESAPDATLPSSAAPPSHEGKPAVAQPAATDGSTATVAARDIVASEPKPPPAVAVEPMLELCAIQEFAADSTIAAATETSIDDLLGARYDSRDAASRLASLKAIQQVLDWQSNYSETIDKQERLEPQALRALQIEAAWLKANPGS